MGTKEELIKRRGKELFLSRYGDEDFTDEVLFPYTITFLTLPLMIEQILSTFGKPIVLGNQIFYIEKAYIGRGMTEQERMKLGLNLMKKPSKEGAEKLFTQRDLDIMAVINYSQNKISLRKYTQLPEIIVGGLPEPPRTLLEFRGSFGYDTSDGVIPIDWFENYMTNFTSETKRPEKSHKEDIFFNGVEIYSRPPRNADWEERHKQLDEGLDRIRTITGNPVKWPKYLETTWAEYRNEALNSFMKKDVVLYEEALTEDYPEAAKYFPRQVA